MKEKTKMSTDNGSGQVTALQERNPVFDSPDWNETSPGPEEAAAAGNPAETEPKVAKQPSKDQRTLLTELILEHYEVGFTTMGQAFVLPTVGPRIPRLLDDSSTLAAEVARRYFEKYGAAPSKGSIEGAMLTLTGFAQIRAPEELHVRVARPYDDVIFDLGRIDGSVVVINKAGWSIEKASPVLFQRTVLTGEVPLPEREGDLEEFRKLLNVRQEAWDLLVGYMVATLLPDIPHPVGLFVGQQGTGKSSVAKMITELIDPSPSPLQDPPTNGRDWIAAARCSWLLTLDNVSEIKPWLSDALCRAVTGAATVYRSLYTNDSPHVVEFQRCVLLTAISTGALRGDLGSRLAQFEMLPIPGAERQQLRNLEQRFEQARPQILGALLDLLVKTLEVLPTVNPATMPRMADFAVVLAAVDQVRDTNSVGLFASNQTSISEDVVDSEPLGEALIKLLSTEGDWQGEPNQLLDKLQRPIGLHPARWPSNPHNLTQRLRGIIPALADLGVQVDADLPKCKGRRQIAIRRVDGFTPTDTNDDNEPF
jgi:hypothetical protein